MTRTEFTCEACKRTLQTEHTDEQAAEEYKQNHGVAPPKEGTAIICDDCYKLLMEHMAKTAVKH